MYSTTPISPWAILGRRLTWIPPRPGRASAGRSTGRLRGPSSWATVPWSVRTGIAATTPRVAFMRSASAAPLALTSTSQKRNSCPTGAVTSQPISLASPGARDTTMGSNLSRRPWALGLTSTVNGRWVVFLRVNPALNRSPPELPEGVLRGSSGPGWIGWRWIRSQRGLLPRWPRPRCESW